MTGAEPWAWVTGTPRERADMIRSHWRFGREKLCDLFNLTDEGLTAILDGDDWTPAARLSPRPDAGRKGWRAQHSPASLFEDSNEQEVQEETTSHV